MSYFRRMILDANKPEVVDNCIRGVYYSADSTTARQVIKRAGYFDWATVDGVLLATPTTSTVMTEGNHDVVLHIKSSTSLSLNSMFYTQPYVSLDFSTAGLGNRTLTMSAALTAMTKLTSINLGKYNFGTCTSAYELFAWNSNLVLDNTGGFDFNNCADMTRMCRSAKKTVYDCAKWGCASTTNLKGIFYDALALTDLVDMEAWQCTSLTDVSEAFRNNSNAFVVKMPRVLDPSGVNFQYAFIASGVTAVYVPSAYLDAYKTAMANANIDTSKIVAYTD